MKQLTIGNVSLANPVILAPMAGVSDLPFRLLCHEQGAGMVCSEMISAKAILYHNKNTEELMQIHLDEGPVSLQLFGSDPDIVSEMAKKIEERPFSVLDLNMGCPVPKVVNNGEGSALMKNPLLAGKIIEKTAKAIQKFARASMMRTSMRLKWQKSRRNPALRLLQCTAGRGSSIIPERRIGTSSHR